MPKCQRCEKFYKKHPLKKEEDDRKRHRFNEVFSMGPVKCAFMRGKFSPKNWNCETMDELRDMCDYEDRDDMRAACIGVIRIPETDDQKIQAGYIVMSWYKNRGKTSQAYVMWDDDEPELLRLRTAEFVIEQSVRDKKRKSKKSKNLK